MNKKKLSGEEKHLLEQFVIPFFHFGKRFPLLPGKNDIDAEAGLIGIDGAELKKYREDFDKVAKKAALELLKEDDIVDLIDKMPFDGEEVIVAIGDSITEDAQGWFNIFKHVLEISVENAGFTFVNAGIAFDTTTDVLRRFDRDVLIYEPDWVFIALGTFDAQRLNISYDKPLISLSETWENLETIQQLVEDRVENPPVWITPAPVISELLDENLLYDFTIHQTDLAQVQQIVAGKQGVIVDPLGRRMGKENPDAWNYLSDGLHPSLLGHMNTVREVIKKLATAKDK